MQLRTLSLIALCCLADANGSHYDVLGVQRTASASEIKRAYRAAALQYHPDKNKDPGAEEQFIRIAQAYEVLGDAAAREQYNRFGSSLSAAGGGSRSGRGSAYHSAASARSMFDENFGEALAKRWRPGMRVTGKRVANGKAYTITINPDGTSEEQEVDDLSSKGGGGFTYVTQTNTRGHTSAHIQVDSLGALAAALVPTWLAGLPLVGGLAITALSWLPTVACLGCCWRLCFRRRRPAAAVRMPGAGRKLS